MAGQAARGEGRAGSEVHAEGQLQILKPNPLGENEKTALRFWATGDFELQCIIWS